MRGIIEPSVKSIETLALSYFNAYKYCFCADSTEKWVRMYASKRWDTLNAIQKDDYNNELTPRLKKVFIEKFTELTLQYIDECKKQKNKKEKAEIKKNGVKRKRD